jgi:hypothetical protein
MTTIRIGSDTSKHALDHYARYGWFAWETFGGENGRLDDYKSPCRAA